MIEKLKPFVASLTNQEIDDQLNDIFGWAKVYQGLLEEEKRSRRSTVGRNRWEQHNNSSNGPKDTICETFADEFPENDVVLEYELEPIEKPDGFSDVNGWAEDIKRLDSEEIFQRYQNELDWTIEYRYLCYAELLRRKESVQDFYGRTQVSDISVVFRIVQQIQNTITNLSLEQTKDRLIKLRRIPEYGLTEEKIAELKFEIETCEFHIYELMDNEGLLCPQCGNEIEENAVFCGNCGKRLK